MPSRLQRALRNGLAPGGNLADELFRLGEYHITTSDDAQEVCEALRRFPLSPSPTHDFFQGWTPLHAVTALFQQVENDAAMAILSEQGVPELIRVFDALLEGPDDPHDALLFVLKVLIMYQSSEGIARVIEAARLPLRPESFLWSIVFEQFDGATSYLPWLFKELSRPLPQGFIAVALLDCANQALRAGHVDAHPFDTPAGRKRLEAWLASSDRSEASYAVSAAAALPFISRPHRQRLLALALDHEEVDVQLEAAWVSASLGSSGGVRFLRRLCLSPATSAAACSYLRELGRDDLVPSEAMAPEFLAMVDLCAWLARTFEYPPDAINLYDTRELIWPPTNDRRRVWLFDYSYFDYPKHAQPHQTVQEVMGGYGMVGSVTYAITEEAFLGRPDPLDIYAVYCCWELQLNKDPRAPSERSVAAGRSILEEFNPPGDAS